MNSTLYRKFAWEGIRKNKQLYYPYLLSASGMTAVFYILTFLSSSEAVRALKGSEPITMLLSYAGWAVGLFSIPFLFYTNSTLLRRRKKELGLYNILGMNRKNLFSVLSWETLISYLITMCIGLLFGILLSKAAELGLVNIMRQDVNYRIYVDGTSIIKSLLMFGAVFLLILLHSLRQIRHVNPIDLLHSDSVGERPPKARWILALLGVIFLLAGYGMSFFMDSVMANIGSVGDHGASAMAIWSFLTIAVLMLGTFLLFLCASVALCALLKKRKNYYYQTGHFVMVSSMSYRMKRNGASLASICILITAVLIMFSFTVSFYMGVKNTIADKYIFDCGATIEIPPEKIALELEDSSCTNRYRDELKAAITAENVSQADYEDFSSLVLFGYLKNGTLDLSKDTRNIWDGILTFHSFNKYMLPDGEELAYVRIISREDYNLWCDEKLTGNEDGIIIACKKGEYTNDHMVLPDGTNLPVAEITNELPAMPLYEMYDRSPSEGKAKFLYLVVPSLTTFLQDTYRLTEYPKNNYALYWWDWGVDLPQDYDRVDEIWAAAAETVRSVSETLGISKSDCYSHADRVDNAQGLTGGMLFIMIVLNIILSFSTALIMYYKQISEGYEDQKQFAIMRKIGMTAREIRQGINAQLLIVFGLPLILAGVHLVGAYGLISYVLGFAISNDTEVIIKSMLISLGVFAVVYVVIYGLTSRTYFHIVNRATRGPLI